MGISSLSISVPVTPIASSDLAAGVQGEGQISICPAVGTSVSGTWIVSIQTGSINNFQMLVGVPAQNDEISYSCYLAAGTYTLVIFGRRDADCGIMTVKIDAATVATLDQYGASSAVIKYSQTGIVITTAGIKTLSIKMATKHASSSGYMSGLSQITLFRTA